MSDSLDVAEWADDLPEGKDEPSWLEAAVDAFNEVIGDHCNDPLSWMPGEQRVVLEDEEIAA